uniref:Bap31/Bap29 cytoplasmic coiled-coil domain-containing protein n=1 Tax=Parascaris equorum TaxID=6256 RepID=A0A914SJB0_PAREQ
MVALGAMECLVLDSTSIQLDLIAECFSCVTNVLRVIKRLVSLLSRGAQLEAAAEAALKQAEGASRAAKSLMGGDNEKVKKLEKEVDEMSRGIKVGVVAELKSAQNDRDAMRQQAEGLQREYDRVCQLLSEHEV